LIFQRLIIYQAKGFELDPRYPDKLIFWTLQIKSIWQAGFGW
jgi:hypothetical protein